MNQFVHQLNVMLDLLESIAAMVKNLSAAPSSDGESTFGKGHTYWNTDSLDFTLPISHASLPRKDRLVLRLDLTNRQITLAMKTGVPASTPLEPPLVSDEMIREIAIATIIVGINSTVISPADITDERVSASYPISFKELIDEYTAELREQLGVDDLHDLKLIAEHVTVTGNGDGVLHSDGVYRKPAVLCELARFTTTGAFSTSVYPSTNNLYHVILLGAGANGHLINPVMGTICGGGAGAMVSVGPIHVPSGSYPIKVGTSTSIGNPESNGETSAFGFAAKGGRTGSGGSGPYSLPGSDGSSDGNGASSPFGSGGIYGSAPNATGYGAGGSAPSHGVAGKGSGGIAIIYGYRGT